MAIYTSNFDELNIIGSGGFGQVFKVRDKFDDQYYAIKKILDQEPEQIEKVLREAKTMAKLNGDRIVRYMNSWVENNCVYIKMELCSDNLRNVIDQKRQYFNRRQTEPLSIIEFYISSQILKELVECVQYLHESKPPIIHRDIKPQNILISKNSKNRNCLKLCDFGLAIFHDISSIYHTTGVGTFKYMAPEVTKGKYNYMTDIFSMGLIAEELFDIDLNESIIHENTLLDNKLNSIRKLILSMLETLISKRPKCDQILGNFENYSLKISQIKSNTDFDTIITGILVKVPRDSIIRDYFEKLYLMNDIITERVDNLRILELPSQIGYVSQNSYEYIPNNIPQEPEDEIAIYHNSQSINNKLVFDECTNSLYFTHDPKKQGSSTKVKNANLKEFFAYRVDGTEDDIIKVEMFKYNIYSLIPKFFGAWHEFTLVKSKNWYWSFEKNSRGICVQRSKSAESVKNYCIGRKRPGTIEPEGRDSKSGHKGDLVQNIIFWIYEENHLNPATGSNSHHFASLLFEAIARQSGRKLSEI